MKKSQPRRLTSFPEKLSQHAKNILRASCDVARTAKTESVQPTHILIAVLLEKESLGSALLHQIGITKEHFAFMTVDAENSSTQRMILPQRPLFSKEAREIVAHAFLLAHRFSYPYVGSEHLVHALADSNDESVQAILTQHGGTHDQQKDPGQSNQSFPFSHFPGFSRLFEFPPFRLDSDGGSQSDETPTIEQFSIPMNHDGASSSFSMRSKELESVLRTLSRKTKSNPLLIGNPGVGKTALVEEIARLIAEGKAGRALEGKRIVLLDLASVVAGTSFRGEFEARLKDLVREAKDHPDIIFFLDEIHTIIGAGNASGGLDASNILKPALARGDIRCIGATTFSEYKRHIEKDSALERRFHVIRIDEPTPEESIRILMESRKEYEEHHHVTISDEAIRAAVALSIKHLPHRFLPDKAFDILDEAAALLRRAHNVAETNGERTATIHALGLSSRQKRELVRNGKFSDAEIAQQQEFSLKNKLSSIERSEQSINKKNKPTLTALTVSEATALLSDTPIKNITDEQISRIQTLMPELSKRIFGQEEAVRAIVNAVSRSTLGFGSKTGRPRGSFLFVGPSGSGKTLSARVLAEVLFGKKQSLLRFDMSEFRERHHMAQLLGSPAGYVGYGEGGKLTEHMRHHPASVILFDEIEKAHPDILNLLLQILEDGTLTDAEGQTAHFSESFIVLTSNIGTSSFSGSRRLGFDAHSSPSSAPDQEERASVEEIRKEIRPEIIARLDHVITFRPLDKDALKHIAHEEIRYLELQLKNRNITLSLPKNADLFIAEKSLNHQDGGRAVREMIRAYLEDPISHLLFSKKHVPPKIRFAITKNALCLRP